MKSRNLVLISAVIVLLLSACTGLSSGLSNASAAVNEAAAAQTDSPAKTITVTGSTKVGITPDIATITVGSREEADSVSAAVQNSNASVESITDALVAAGVAHEDIQTSNFSVYTNEQWGPDGTRSGTTYVAENTVYITVRDLDNLGAILGDAVDAGANNIYGIQFDASDKTDAMSQGREDALQNASDQAEELAGLSNLTITGVQSITHYASNYLMNTGMGGAGMAADSAVPISPGQMTVQVEVTVVYIVE